MGTKTINLSEEQFLKISGFLTTGYRDYLASRLLFNEGQLYRAIILANTSIEKYLKVINTINGKNLKTHNVEKLFEEAGAFDKQLVEHINAEFIKLISLSYNLRYLDNDIFVNPKKDFRIAIAQYKSLAELDYLVYIFQNSLKVSIGDLQLISMYDEHLQEKSQYLFNSNYVLNNIKKSDFIEKEQMIYKAKTDKLPSGRLGFFERFYKSSDVKDDGKFLIF